MGGYALKMFRLTVKRGWSVCIIAYNDNAHCSGAAAAYPGVHVSGVVNRAGLFRKLFISVLCVLRVTLPPRISDQLFFSICFAARLW